MADSGRAAGLLSCQGCAAGLYDELNPASNVGRVGTGWDTRAGQELRDALDPLRTAEPPFARLPAAAKRGARWIRPELVAEVRFQTWTADGMLRHASFQGLREDRPPAGVVRERERCAGHGRARSGGRSSCTGLRISSSGR